MLPINWLFVSKDQRNGPMKWTNGPEIAVGCLHICFSFVCWREYTSMTAHTNTWYSIMTPPNPPISKRVRNLRQTSTPSQATLEPPHTIHVFVQHLSTLLSFLPCHSLSSFFHQNHQTLATFIHSQLPYQSITNSINNIHMHFTYTLASEPNRRE